MSIPDGSLSNSASEKSATFSSSTISPYGSPFPSQRSTSSFEVAMSVATRSLHGNLMRSIQNKDPMKTYKVANILGEGSMGSVAKVKKRDSARSGSARSQLGTTKKKNANVQNCCFSIFSFCSPKQKEDVFVVSDSTSLWPSSQQSSWSSSDESRNRVLRKHPSLYSANSNTNGAKLNPHKDIYYALKSIHLDRCENAEFQMELKNEVAILKEMDHPNIVRAIETFHFRRRLFLVLELCSGGDLYTRDPYSEKEAVRIVACLTDAISYLHSKGIVHRDLKFENVMFTDTRKDAEIKIIDFGLSKKFAKDSFLKDAVGTVYTMSPELVAGSYNEKTDVWSLGVLSFMLLSSSMPFYGKTRNQVLKKITRGKFHYSSRRWKTISTEAKDFVADLLVPNPAERPSAEEAMTLPWMARRLEQEEINIKANVDMMDLIQGSIQAFVGYGVLKKLALMVVAYRSTADEIGFLRKMFSRFDTLHDGEISEDEFAQALAVYNYQPREIHELYRGIDVDGTGSVHYIEFLAATLEALGRIDEERLAEAFDRIDGDDTGYISIQNLRDFLGDEVPVESIEKIIDEADLDHDRRISYQEFLDMWDLDSAERLKVARKNVTQRRIISREPSFVSSISSSNSGSRNSRDDLLAELQKAEELVSSEAFNTEMFSSTDTVGREYEKKDDLERDAVWV